MTQYIIGGLVGLAIGLILLLIVTQIMSRSYKHMNDYWAHRYNRLYKAFRFGEPEIEKESES